MDTMEPDTGYTPMHSVYSFQMSSGEKNENIYENPNQFNKFNSIGKVCQVGKQVWRPILCLALICSVLLVIVLLIFKNSSQKDELYHIYTNLSREREALKLQLYQLERLKQDLSAEKTKLERRLTDLDHVQGNLMEQITAAAITSINKMNKKKLSELGWHYFSTNWYYLSSLKRNWSYSQQDCIKKGGDLVVINSQEEQLFLAELAVSAWIGLTDVENEGVWKWVDNSTLSVTYWAEKQPNNLEGQDCVVIWDRTNRFQTWNDEKCDRKLQWICEI